MGRSDDSIARRKNKKNNKKQQGKGSSKVSSRIASLIAAKKRRKSGKRRMCQGMCFSLPTPEDPFNDRPLKLDSIKKKKKSSRSKVDKVRLQRKLTGSLKDSPNTNRIKMDDHKQNVAKLDELVTESIRSGGNSDIEKNVVNPRKKRTLFLEQNGAKNCGEAGELVSDAPSKFLIFCLNSIQNALLDEMSSTGEKEGPFFARKWGVEFWKLYSSGKDMLTTCPADSAPEKIAWLASCAADTIARKEKEGLSLSTPFLLFLLPSQEKTAEVRHIFKPLKAIGIHSVSLHSGASIDHQIHGLRCCEPEFLLSTPARLLELLSLKAIDISGVSLLVVDGIETHPKDDFLNCVKLIRQLIIGNPQTVVFSDCTSDLSLGDLKGLFQEPVTRLTPDNER